MILFQTVIGEDFDEMFQYDYYRYYGDEKVFKYKWPYELKYIYYLRKLQQGAKGIGAKYYSFCLNYLSKKTFIQIPYTTKIGKGFYIGHSGRVIINPNVVIGNNVNIATGITIGRENRGNGKALLLLEIMCGLEPIVYW